MKGRAGYSLFEVLLAFAILAMVLSTLLPGQASLLRRVSDVPAQTLAQDFALSELAAIGVSDPLQFGSKEKIYRGWRVSIEILPDKISDIAFAHIKISIFKKLDDHLLATVESRRPIE